MSGCTFFSIVAVHYVDQTVRRTLPVSHSVQRQLRRHHCTAVTRLQSAVHCSNGYVLCSVIPLMFHFNSI